MVEFVGAPSGAQESPPSVTTIPADGTSSEQAVSDDGSIVVFEVTNLDPDTESPATQVLIHDRSTGSTLGVPTPNAQNPSISGNGCFVTYSTFTPAVEPPAASSTTSSSVPDDLDDPNNVDDTGSGDEQSSDSEVGESGADEALALDIVEAPVTTSSLQAAPSTSSLFAFDRCSGPGAAPVLVASANDTPAAIPAAAVSTDGVFIAYSNFDDVVRMEGTLTGYSPGVPFDTAIAATPGEVTGSRLDISSDGSIVVFEAGTDATPGDRSDPVDFGVYAWTDSVAPNPPTVTRLASKSTSPSISGDSSLVAFESVAGSDSTFSGVVVQTLVVDGGGVNISIDPGGSQPDISDDGRHVVYNTTTGRTTLGMAMTSSVGSTNTPFEGVAITDLSAASAGADATTFAVSGPAVSAFGDVVAFDADVTAQPAGTLQSVAVRSLPASGVLDAATYDLGSADVGETLSVTLTYTNQGPASLGLGPDAIVVEDPFVVSANGCGESVGPGVSCEIEVSLTIDSLEDVFGSIAIVSHNGSRVDADLTGLGAPVTTSTEQATTTTPPNTTRTTTRTTTRNTTRTTTRNTTRTTTRNTTRTTTRNTTRSTTTTVAEIDLPPAFEPATFDFAPTIIGAGVRTASVDVVNSGSSTETLSTATFADAAAGFTVVDTTCTSLTVGARCTINLSFAPTSEGALSSDLVVTFASGTEIRSAITGTGAPVPTLTVVPGVATVGQVVTIQGGGFPAGSTVSLSFGSDTNERAIVVNDGGAFNLPLVVLPNTPSGPLMVSIAGQEELFADVDTEMLVTKTNNRANPGVLGTLGARIGR